jgi:dihydroflavonol-4-reductase
MRLVSGATGLVGSYICCELIKKGFTVRALKRESASTDWFYTIARYAGIAENELLSKLEWVDSALSDPIGLASAMRGVEKVYHCAALVSFAPKDQEALYISNVEGTAAIVNAALSAGVKKVVYVSSIAALSRKSDGETITEATEWEDSPRNSNYSKSKYYGELEMWRGQEEGLEIAIVNPAFILGFGNPAKSSTGIIQKIRKGFLFYTEGINGYVDVEDVASATVMIGESNVSGERFILSAWNLSYKELFFSIARAFACRPPKFLLSRKTGLVLINVFKILHFLKIPLILLTPDTIRTAISSYYYSSEKLQTRFNFTFTPFETSINRIAEKFKAYEKEAQ